LGIAVRPGSQIGQDYIEGRAVIKIRPNHAAPWELSLQRLLPLWGHRNWIVVADSAYPAQSNPGIETILTEADHLHVLQAVLAAIDNSRHVRAGVYLDAELDRVAAQDVQDEQEVIRYRQELARLIGNRETQVLAHDRIIAKLDESAKLFRILILKSTLAIPYTSVFLELQCGYWSRQDEERLRLSMASGNP
jgi:L-fucose mutarotase/ribose pyranase (RbsD/FucU family)